MPVDTEPVPLNYDSVCRHTPYPARARWHRIEGTVYVRVLVDAQGRYVDHRVLREIHPWLATAVAARVPDLRFDAAQAAGQPVAAWINLTFPFRLRTPPAAVAAGQQVQGAFLYRGLYRNFVAQGQTCLGQADYQGALRYFERARALLPRSAHARQRAGALDLYMHIGQCALRTQSWKKAIWSFTEAVLTHPGSDADSLEANLRLDRALALHADGQRLAALSDCNWVLKRHAGFALRGTAHLRRAMVLAEVGDFSAALNDLQLAEELLPHSPEVHFLKASILHELHACEAAHSSLATALGLGLPGEVAIHAAQWTCDDDN
ncbi:MAG: hypothetical protein OHK0039_29460 [Bacteroidia bacterium]